MIVSAEAQLIINYLNTAEGKFFSLQEISRRAAGKQRFEECPGWAKNLMPRLLESGLVEVNPRGHYRVPQLNKPAKPSPAARASSPTRHRPAKAVIVGDNYFPAPQETPRVVGGDYFPAED